MSIATLGDAATSKSLVEVARSQASAAAESDAYIYLNDGETDETRLTFGTLDRRARAIAAALQNAGARGKRAVLLYPPDLSFIEGLFGCMYAGTIAVPAYPPDPSRVQRTLPRLLAIVADCEADVILTISPVMMIAGSLFSHAPELAAKQWIATDTLPLGTESDWRPEAPSPEDVAFLQYTSGSTGAPKGVILSHGNLLHNIGLITKAFAIGPESVGVSWLPPYHDMGLIGGILAPLFNRRPTVLMSPLAFLQRPTRWLKAVSRYHATISGGPNFAYELCVRKTPPEERDTLDLSSWKVAFTGAEPVRADTINRFTAAFERCGFDARSVFPCYGLAEATLIVSGGPPGRGASVHAFSSSDLGQNVVIERPDEEGAIQRLTACGEVLGDQEVVIASADGAHLCRPDEVGEIWVSGSSVAGGYWGKPWLTRDMFLAQLPGSSRRYLRTGDMGFLRDGQLFITGRLKDLIVIRGKNHYPQDIERTVEECHPGLRRGCCASFSVELQGEERVVVVVEVERRRRDRRASSIPPGNQERRRGSDRRAGDRPDGGWVGAVDKEDAFDADAVYSAVRHAVLRDHDLHVYDVVLLKPGHIPKTSSGKVRRKECVAKYLDGTLDVVVSGILQADGPTSVTIVPRPDFANAMLAGDAAQRLASAQRLIIGLLARTLNTSRSRFKGSDSVAGLGLDSLMAMEVAHRLERTLGVCLSPTSFLGEVTIEHLAARLIDRLVANQEGAHDLTPRSETRERILAEAAAVPIEHVPRGTEIELSPSQERFWLLHQLDASGAAYNVTASVAIEGQIHVDAFLAAMSDVIEAQQIFHCALVQSTHGPRQVAGPPVRFRMDVEDVSTDSPSARREALSTVVARLGNQPFTLENPPLIRATLLRFSSQRHAVVVCAHHLVVDGWSMSILAREVAKAYVARVRGLSPSLSKSGIQYVDYAAWQRRLPLEAFKPQLDYWAQKLRNVEPLDFPFDGPIDGDDHAAGDTSLTLRADLVEGMRVLARGEGATLFMAVAAALVAVLRRWTGQTDITIGTPIANRSRSDLDDLVGCFVNNVALRIDSSGAPSFVELLDRVRRTSLEAFANQDVPFERVIDTVQPQRRPGRAPLFDVFLNFMHSPLRGVSIPDLDLALQPTYEPIARFLLGLYVEDDGARLGLRCVFRKAAIAEDRAKALLAELETVLAAAVAEPQRPLPGRAPLDPALRELVVRKWNQTERAVVSTTVHGLVERQARLTPQAVAIRSERQALSYEELDRRANQLANALVTRGLSPEQVVGIHLRRTTDVIVAVLGVLKAGLAYLPLDQGFPAERLKYIVRDSEAALIISDAGGLRGLPVPVLALDDPAVGGASSASPELGVSPRQLAYVMYTSGSTGQPKGVEVEHGQVVNFLESMRIEPGMTAGEVLVGVTTLSFDISVLEIFLPLVVGASVVIATREEARDGRKLADILAASGATIMQATPSGWRLLLDSGWAGGPIRALCGGEPLSEDLASRLGERVSRLFNVYGPTETTVWSTLAGVNGGDVDIGRPIANTQVYVLTTELEPVSPGTWGELYIGGLGVTRGYHRKAALTAERFLPDPFSQRTGARLYRTGDRARWTADGRLECGGRFDHQTKIRGHRVELGEIEAALRGHGTVAEAVVAARETGPGDVSLVAFVEAARPGRALPHSSSNLPRVLRAFLAQKLPEFMLPSAIHVVDSLPRLPNGKIDRHSLPFGEVTARVDYVAPRNGLEVVVASVWEEVLTCSPISVTADFFALGGNSILATGIRARLKRLLAVDVPLRSLLEEPTIAAVAKAIEDSPGGATAVHRADRIASVLTMTEAQAEEAIADGAHHTS